VAQQFETAQFLPSSVTGQLSGELVCYSRFVVGTEWPILDSGEQTREVNPWGIAMFHTLKSAQPRSATEQAAYSKWLDQTSERESARMDRLHGAEGVIPWLLWVILIVIALVIFGFTMFFADSGEPALVQGVQIGSVVLVMVSMLLLIRFLDHPFQGGPGGLQPTAMERTLSIVQDELAGIGNHGLPPCNARGIPT
jgi:hypothetical protein